MISSLFVFDVVRQLKVQRVDHKKLFSKDLVKAKRFTKCKPFEFLYLVETKKIFTRRVGLTFEFYKISEFGNLMY